MPYKTDERLKSYLDTNQLSREQMCRAILSIDKRFKDVRPRHPRGGKDGGRDIEAVYKENQKTYGAVGFLNQANDSREQKQQIKNKFNKDLSSALDTENKPEVFVFLTNISLTIGEKDDLLSKATKMGLSYCDVFDRERLRIILDSPDGFSIRFQYLNISLSEAEQASFFAKWGDDIQSVISTGFQKIKDTLGRILFLQEASSAMTNLTVTVKLDRKYSAEEIGHFRLFCVMQLREPKHNIMSLLFGACDKAKRKWCDSDIHFNEQPGIKYGMAGGQWERYISFDDTAKWNPRNKDEGISEYKLTGSTHGGGTDFMEFLSISYSEIGFIRLLPRLSLNDIDNAMFLPVLNKSLAEKVNSIHIYADGYKLQETLKSSFHIDANPFDQMIPVEFSSKELNDPWVRIRPTDCSAFRIQFFEETPKRIFAPSQISINSQRYPY
ncbi:hypothetical protein KAR91_14135 [Candidatus Pacearchaeota archaeon]|nr:hypothetical protein [Candidatus Pacearchaeota archaeon]